MSLSPRSAFRTLIATSRSRVSSIALYTVPIPPLPRRSTIRYLPTVLPIMGSGLGVVRQTKSRVRSDPCQTGSEPDLEAEPVSQRVVGMNHERVAAGHEGLPREARQDSG